MAIRSLKSGSFSRSTQVGNSIILPGDYESIATTTVGAGGTSSITFSSIPSTFTHLQIRAILRNTVSGYGGQQTTYYRFNSDTGSNYSWHFLSAQNDSSPSFNISSGTTATYMDLTPHANISDGGLSNTYGVAIVDILDYTNTNKYKTVRALNGVDQNATGGNTGICFSSGNWRSTSAIDTITISSAGGGNWKQYSHFALYGIRG